jgi:hypothetical protein
MVTYNFFYFAEAQNFGKEVFLTLSKIGVPRWVCEKIAQNVAEPILCVTLFVDKSS